MKSNSGKMRGRIRVRVPCHCCCDDSNKGRCEDKRLARKEIEEELDSMEDLPSLV